MVRNFDDMFNEVLYGKRRRQDNTLIDNWIDECLFEDSEEDIDRCSIPTSRRWINGDREEDMIAFSKITLQMNRCTTAIWMLAYGVAADAVDDYVRIDESTTIECLEKFVEGVISMFEDEYLRKTNPIDVRRLLQMAEGCGFPGMLGNIDCMHWQ
ncbi:hypothetical protein Ahy_B02g059351 [Arachis hypogaea]|uniref:Uncharacterized protein n=1 Tax=Arachis hypogaea TaxID=3818 RepID=A0A445AGH2_ARAHY|nr:hypothetical protein Ahy_B02g059351 [Arachis hypogaea]